MTPKWHKLFTGAAILSIGMSCFIAPAAQAGSIPLNGVYGWGQNASGSLGIGNSSITPTPTISANQVQNITRIATSSTHTLFLDREGNVYASGDNSRGQLGTGNTTSSNTAVKVTLPLRFGVPDYATQVWASEGVSFMRGSYGDLYSWGSNDNGLTGLGEETGETLVPTKVAGISLADEGKEKLSISSTAVAVVSNTPPESPWQGSAQLFTWGENDKGVLGRPSETGPIVSAPQRVLISDPNESATKPVDVCDVDGNCTSEEVPKTYDELVGLAPERVAVGKDFFVAVAGGIIHTWGTNDKGQLGMNLPTTAFLSTPTTSSALYLENFASVTSLAAGEDHVILLGSDGLVYGWGDNSKSQVAPYYSGSNQQSFLDVLQRLTIKKELADTSPWAYVVAGDDTSYGITSGNDAYGWGDNSSGEIANTKDVVVQAPEKITFPYQTEISTFVAGGNNAVAVSDYTIEYNDINISTTIPALPAVSAHQDYSYTLTSANGYPGKSHNWTIYGLPDGLSYDSNTGRIYGQSTEIGTFNVQAMVTDNVAESTKDFTLEVTKSSPKVNVTYTSISPGVTRATIDIGVGITGATGTATLKYGTATKTVTLANGTAKIDITGIPGAKLNASVTYNGSATMNTATSTVQSITVTPKYASTVSAIYKSSNPGQITATIYASRGATKGTGIVTFQYGTVKKTATLVNGAATITVAAVAGTKYTVNASYSGSATLAPSSAKATTITTMKKRTATVTATYASLKKGQVTTYVTVKDGKANATGVVTLYVGTLKRSVTLVNGKAAITIAAAAGKRYSVKTVYGGSVNLNALTTPTKLITTRAR